MGETRRKRSLRLCKAKKAPGAGLTESQLSNRTHQRGGSAKSSVIDRADWANYRADDRA